MQTGRGRVQQRAGGRRCGSGVNGDRQKRGFGAFERKTKGDCAKRCNSFNLLEISC